MNKLDEKDDIIYLLVGQGELEDEYRELIKSYKLEKHVWLMGFRKDVGELCTAADVFIHPSIREGFGISLMEAMASGLPLISANINGIKDYTENRKTGICVDPTDIDEIVKAIKWTRNNPLFLKQCGIYNTDKAKKFDIANTDQIMEEIYLGGVLSPDQRDDEKTKKKRNRIKR